MNLSRGPQSGPKKVVIYGPEGIGKSTFASHFPSPVFIDTEGSTKHLDVLRVDPMPASFTELIADVKDLTGIADGMEISTIVLDTADWADKLCCEEVCKSRNVKGIEDFGYGKGYTYVSEEFAKLLRAFDAAIANGLNVVVTAHAQMRKFEQPDELGAYDRWELKCSKKTAAMLKEWADMLIFANYKTLVTNVDNKGAVKGKNKASGGKRVMYTSHHPCWDAKNRFGLEDELPLDYAAITSLIPTRKPAITQDDAQETPPVQTAQDRIVAKMEETHVTREEVETIVTQVGYFPAGTAISQYPDDFIDTELIPKWDKLMQRINALRFEEENNDLPF